MGKHPTTADHRTFHIHLNGKVQGVGFRPFVYRLANEHRLTGWVNNGLDGVHIRVNGSPAGVQQFYRILLRDYPSIASVTHSEMREVAQQQFSDFRVSESDGNGIANLLILPDLDMCDDCRAELNDPHNRRNKYAFITCTNCGPRYSIITKLPYDRPNTTMAPFAMCPDCQTEYDHPADRRFYSQTNSCNTCGIRLELISHKNRILATNETAIRQAAAKIRKGNIVAMRGLGGFLLLADALNPKTVQQLRKRKHRPAKPFALMVPDLSAARKYASISPAEAAELTSREKPIVILESRSDATPAIAESVAPGHDTLGIMLPHTPLHELLMQELQQPVIATSANISGSPILATDAEILDLLGDVCDFVLTHNRDIVMPQDDSVVRFSPLSGTHIVMRRSRSFAPIYHHGMLKIPENRAVLAMGARQKSTISICHQGNIFISQYLGDLGSYETEQLYLSTIDHLTSLLKFSPQSIVVDSHPNYESTNAGKARANSANLPVTELQHHRAHFWALLAENELLDTKSDILGFIWDGTGYGDDSAIWGSESFIFSENRTKRTAHLDYFPLLAGDKAALEPRISAFSLLNDHPEKAALLQQKFSAQEWQIYHRLLKNEHAHPTSSMGRLFDAVASLLGLADKVSFEGEAAMLLERLAWRFVRENGVPENAVPYPFGYSQLTGIISHQPAISAIVDDIRNGKNPAEIAFCFHFSLIKLIEKIAVSHGLKHLGFSGGVFQNALLVDLSKLILGDYQLFFHRHLSPNDENISFGQLVFATKGQTRESEISPEKHIVEKMGK
ncbi:MAG: carbamoyltransferase HypF [Calditrichaeota bacterium]|nr:carbamoyltransferase HypF [Calditrichota bacterium]